VPSDTRSSSAATAGLRESVMVFAPVVSGMRSKALEWMMTIDQIGIKWHTVEILLPFMQQ
jgi:hypothetical protein